LGGLRASLSENFYKSLTPSRVVPDWRETSVFVNLLPALRCAIRMGRGSVTPLNAERPARRLGWPLSLFIPALSRGSSLGLRIRSASALQPFCNWNSWAQPVGMDESSPTPLPR